MVVRTIGNYTIGERGKGEISLRERTISSHTEESVAWAQSMKDTNLWYEIFASGLLAISIPYRGPTLVKNPEKTPTQSYHPVNPGFLTDDVDGLIDALTEFDKEIGEKVKAFYSKK